MAITATTSPDTASGPSVSYIDILGLFWKRGSPSIERIPLTGVKTEAAVVRVSGAENSRPDGEGAVVVDPHAYLPALAITAEGGGDQKDRQQSLEKHLGKVLVILAERGPFMEEQACDLPRGGDKKGGIYDNRRLRRRKQLRQQPQGKEYNYRHILVSIL